MPSPAVLADQGVKAVKAGQYLEGIEKLTEALTERPAPLWLLERSKAYLRTNDFDLALWDADKALRVAFDRANRDQMIEAQVRRAVTYFRMGKYADADICAFWAIKLCEGARATEDDGQQNKVDSNGDYAVTAKEVSTEFKSPEDKQMDLASAMKSDGQGKRSLEAALKNQAFSWRLQALTQMETLDSGAPGRKVTVPAKYPTPSKEPPVKKVVEEKKPVQESSKVEMDDAKEPAAQPSGPSTGREGWENLWSLFRSMHAKKDIRSSFYQSDSTLNVDIFVKNVNKDEFKVDAQSDRVILAPVPNVEEIHLLLYGKIRPAEIKYTVKSMKIELVMAKETPGKWPILRKENAELFDNLSLGTAASFNQFYSVMKALGYNEPEDAAPGWQSANGDEWSQILVEKMRQAVSKTDAPSQNEGPAPPKLADSKPSTTVAPAASTSEDKEPAPSAKGPAYPTSSKRGPMNWDKFEDEEEADKNEGDVNSFFQQIYKNADEDTKRAMMKSYIESNGTSLSTSWSEAKEKTYETLPPDGSEAKKWDP